jgi:hypothetical protein
MAEDCVYMCGDIIEYVDILTLTNSIRITIDYIYEINV